MKIQNICNKLTQIITLAEECRSNLEKLNYKNNTTTRQPHKPALANTQKSKINFNQNSRAFFKEYGKGLTGPKRFVLVVAYLSKSKKKLDVTSEDVKTCWNKHSRLLGGKLTTGIYGTRAKENGWLDATKNGSYHLTARWDEIF
ncbi:MAG: hypothetical protein PHD51_02155 [Patescibacteria group bacterium]|nr:hypothetical protein [Patescibacteria group bacterium]MDD5490336.1 hypothetical protein [Patescibacteria group bacterium]